MNTNGPDYLRSIRQYFDVSAPNGCDRLVITPIQNLRTKPATRGLYDELATCIPFSWPWCPDEDATTGAGFSPPAQPAPAPADDDQDDNDTETLISSFTASLVESSSNTGAPGWTNIQSQSDESIIEIKKEFEYESHHDNSCACVL